MKLVIDCEKFYNNWLKLTPEQRTFFVPVESALQRAKVDPAELDLAALGMWHKLTDMIQRKRRYSLGDVLRWIADLESAADLKAVREMEKASRELAILELLASDEPAHDPYHPEWRMHVRRLIKSAKAQAEVLGDADGVREYHKKAQARAEIEKEKKEETGETG